MKKNIIYVFLATIIFALSCVSPYEIRYSTKANLLFVEANLNDYDDDQYIKIGYNVPRDGDPTFEVIENAKVSVFEANTIEYQTKFSKEGFYKLPKQFKVKINTPYSLKIALETGEVYTSSNESLIKKAPAIDSLYAVYKTTGINYDNRNLSGHEIYLDLKDSPSKDDYYLWRWKLYEKRDICVSCYGGRFFTNPLPNGVCSREPSLEYYGLTYDYECNADCWKIIFSKQLNIMSDKYNNGTKINNRLLGGIPFLQYRPALVQAEQYLISKDAYYFYNLVSNQAQTTGTLTDSPPAPLSGNIKNRSNPSEFVGGIFSVSSKSVKTFWLERLERTANIIPYGLNDNGRIINLEPRDPLTGRPPLSPCIESKTNTGIKPKGWK